jgi:hypothetical protein
MYYTRGKNTYNVLVAKHEGKRPIKRPRCRCEYNIKMDFKEVELQGVDWINPAEGWD